MKLTKTVQTIFWNIEDIIQATNGQWMGGDKNRILNGVSIDSRHITSQELFVAIKGENHDGHDYLDQVIKNRAGAIVVQKTQAGDAIRKIEISRDLDLACVAVEDTVTALGDLARWHRRSANVTVAAITGTNGKTTTKEMAALVVGRSRQVLATAGNYNNNIGLPLTLLRLDKTHQAVIVELGMNAPGEIKYLTQICQPDLGVILNVGPGHLEGLGDIDGVAQAKGELLEEIGGGTAILNMDDDLVMGLAPKATGPIVTFGINPKADIRATRIRHRKTGLLFDIQLGAGHDITDIKLPAGGAYIISNALAAAAIGHILDITGQEIKAALESFSTPSGRMNIIKIEPEITLIDDTYNANPASLKASVAGLCSLKGDHRGIIVLGDMYELGDQSRKLHEAAGALVAQAGLDKIYATGQFAEDVKKGAQNEGLLSEKIMTGTKQEITEKLQEEIATGDWVLFKGSRGMKMETVVTALTETDQAQNNGRRQ